MAKSETGELVDGYRKVSSGYSFMYLDEALYWLCKKYPDHTDKQKVFGKISLVNNAYRANIQTTKKGAEWALAEYLSENNFDNIISPLKTIPGFDITTCQTVVQLHSEFVKITFKVLGRNCYSFCAKYLYFHFPSAVPIFDRRAYKTAWRLAGSEVGDRPEFDQLRNSDYAYYCACLLKIIERLQTNGIKDPSLKTIDVLLYDVMY